MAVICTKSVPEDGPRPGPQIPFITAYTKRPIHKMRSDIPKLGDRPLDKYEF